MVYNINMVSILIVAILGMAGLIDDITEYQNMPVVVVPRKNSFVLGGVAWMSPYSKSIAHEYGHWLQEKKYGIAYLPVVGLSSLLGHLLCRTEADYYRIPTEAEADWLGGVVR
jgi:hypothetical protein